jgi:hypothetical protein
LSDGRGWRRSSCIAVVTTYTIEGSGPFDEDEVREKIRTHCDEHGFHAAVTLTVIEIRADTKEEKRVDPGKFLD